MPRLKSIDGYYQIQYGASTIPYELISAKRKTLAIHVYPDLRVTVKAPRGAKLNQIETILLKRAGWILRQLQKFEQNPVVQLPPRQYVEGETYRYMGDQYQLKLIQAEKAVVALTPGTITVSVKDTSDKKRIARLLDQWFRSQAERVFHERLEVCFPRLEWLGIPYPPMTIRSMKSRWGSCSGKGKITLNLKLIYMPEDLIDYVILHELCHLKELNHSPAFYALLARVLPDWKEQRKRLNHIPLF